MLFPQSIAVSDKSLCANYYDCHACNIRQTLYIYHLIMVLSSNMLY